MEQKTYIAIDLKSFYASVECAERGLDPLTTNLVVADESRTEKTICLAVSPSLKAYGIPGRTRLFEVIQKTAEINALRKRNAPGQRFSGSSCDESELKASPQLALDYIVAVPRMAHYIACSTRIYSIYLKYISSEDIHVYSIDEVFIDASAYLQTYRLSARQLAMKMILDVLKETGITATAGIGPNLYLSKIAMDIEAKHIPADENGVRIAELDEISYRRSLWSHRPLTDFWRIGRGIARKLEEHGLYTMGDVARCSTGKPGEYYNEELLYQLFGVNAELLIDHAWGWEPCTIAAIKAYKPENNSIGSGQVLPCPYSAEKAQIVIREMADQLALDLTDKGFVTSLVSLTIGFDRQNLEDSESRQACNRPLTSDHFGRAVPKHTHDTARLSRYTSSSKIITEAVLALFDQIMDQNLLIRRIYLTAEGVVPEAAAPQSEAAEQMDLFTDYQTVQKKKEQEEAEIQREKRVQQAALAIKKKYGKNAILKGVNLKEGATGRERNERIGGHKR